MANVRLEFFEYYGDGFAQFAEDRMEKKESLHIFMMKKNLSKLLGDPKEFKSLAKAIYGVEDDSLIDKMYQTLLKETEFKRKLEHVEKFGDGFGQYYEWCIENQAPVNISQMKQQLSRLVKANDESLKAFIGHCQISFQVPSEELCYSMYQTLKKELKMDVKLDYVETFGDGFGQYYEYCINKGVSVDINKMKKYLTPLVNSGSKRAFAAHCRNRFHSPDNLIDFMYETLKKETEKDSKLGHRELNREKKSSFNNGFIVGNDCVTDVFLAYILTSKNTEKTRNIIGMKSDLMFYVSYPGLFGEYCKNEYGVRDDLVEPMRLVLILEKEVNNSKSAEYFILHSENHYGSQKELPVSKAHKTVGLFHRKPKKHEDGSYSYVSYSVKV